METVLEALSEPPAVSPPAFNPLWYKGPPPPYRIKVPCTVTDSRPR